MTIVVLRSQATPETIDRVVERLRALGFGVQISQGSERTILLLPDGSPELLPQALGGMEGVERIQSLVRPYRLAAREVRPEGTLVSIDGLVIGAGRPVVIGGPASPFSRAISTAVATELKKAGIDVLRAGVYRSPSLLYATPQLDPDALTRLSDLRRAANLPVAVTPLAAEDVPLLARSADILIISAEETANRSLLQACGYVDRSLVLTRGFSASVDEWLQTADELLGRGNRQLVLAAGGIRTFETATRRTLDLSAIPLIKLRSHLPAIADLTELDAPDDVLSSLALSAIGAGADGLLLDTGDEHGEENGTFSPATLATLIPQVRRLAARLR